MNYQLFFALIPTWNDCLTSLILSKMIQQPNVLSCGHTAEMHKIWLDGFKGPDLVSPRHCKCLILCQFRTNQWSGSMLNFANTIGKCHVSLTQPSGVGKDMDQVEVVCTKAEAQCPSETRRDRQLSSATHIFICIYPVTIIEAPKNGCFQWKPTSHEILNRRAGCFHQNTSNKNEQPGISSLSILWSDKL